MAELLEVELGGRTLLSFDGRVLEIFGNIYAASARLDAVRIHVKQLSVKASAPDKNQLRDVGFVGPVGYEYRFRGLDETTWRALEPLIGRLQAAGATVDAPSS